MPAPTSNEKWKTLHDDACVAPGYLFDKNHRNCWAVIIRPGDSNDGGWEDDSKPFFKTIERDGYTGYIREDLNTANDYQTFSMEVFDAGWDKIMDDSTLCPDIAQACVNKAIDMHQAKTKTENSS